MAHTKKFTAIQLNKFRELIELRRRCLFEDVQQLSNVLQGLTNSYRLLVGAADEFNKISFSSKDDVDDAVDRADDLGDLIDDVIAVLDIKLKIYLKDVKKIRINDESLLKVKLDEDEVLAMDEFYMLEEYLYNENQ